MRPSTCVHHALLRYSQRHLPTTHTLVSSACLGRRRTLCSTSATATGSAATGLAVRMGLGAPPPPSGARTKSTAASSHSSPSSPSTQSPLQRTAQIANHLQSPAAPRTHRFLSTMASSPRYSVRKIAAPNTLEHRVYVEKDGVPVSPFHDIPLYANQEQTILNMVVEIPRWTNGKLEVCFVSCSVLLRRRRSCARLTATPFLTPRSNDAACMRSGV